MRYFLALSLLAASACSVATPLFQTLVWNPNYCTSCYINGQPQPAAQPYAMSGTGPGGYPSLQQELDAQQIESAIRADQIRQDHQEWLRRYANTPTLPE